MWIATVEHDGKIRSYLSEISQVRNQTVSDTYALYILSTKTDRLMVALYTGCELSCYTGIAIKRRAAPVFEQISRVDRNQYKWLEIEQKYPWLGEGGHGKPRDCVARQKVAIIVPYRNREDHLKMFVNNLHAFLQPQELDYSIVIVEQIPRQTFNRAKLMNVGFVEALKVFPWECFIFHDVDLLPEDDRNIYSCSVMPRHMSASIDIHNNSLLHERLFGGVVSLTAEQVKKINGYPNDYWGWGGEDDDLIVRVEEAGYNYTRFSAEISRYTMHKHEHAADDGNGENECRWRLLADASNRWRANGLNNLKYHVVKTTFNKTYMGVLVDLLEETSKPDIPAHLNCTY